jgi:trimeric autotransporter adhesin
LSFESKATRVIKHTLVFAEEVDGRLISCTMDQYQVSVECLRTLRATVILAACCVSAVCANAAPAIIPTNPIVIVGQQQQFSVGATEDLGWSVWPQGMGVIDPAGLYTAPNQAGIAVIAAQPKGGLVQRTFVRIVGASPTEVSVSIAPRITWMNAGKSIRFSTLVQGSTETQLMWRVSPEFGNIADGIYTVPESLLSHHEVLITATSIEDAGKSASALVYLVPSLPSEEVTVSVYPTSQNVIAGGFAQFTAAVTGIQNPDIVWSLNPPVGNVLNGLYAAPADLSAPETVIITAAPRSDPAKSASAKISLAPASMAIAPGAVTVSGGGSAGFSASVNGHGATALWSIRPAVGQIGLDGTYSAPSSISTPQTVTVTATGVLPVLATATATVNLVPVAVSLSPSTAGLNVNQSSSFVATVTGSSDTAVSWSLMPPVGSIANGVYHAPSMIATEQSVTISATSQADTTKVASATVNLIPVSISVTPAKVSLGPGGSATLSAVVNGTNNQSVYWSLSPALGTIANGVYTAPSHLSSTASVTISAASVVDPSKVSTRL